MSLQRIFVVMLLLPLYYFLHLILYYTSSQFQEMQRIYYRFNIYNILANSTLQFWEIQFKMRSNNKSNKLRQQQLYIPTQEERIKIYSKISDNQENNKQTTVSMNAKSKQLRDQRLLTKEQLKSLMQRLLINTKKQFQIKKQIEDLQTANKIKKEKIQQSERVQLRLLQKGKLLQQKKQVLKAERQRQLNSELQSKPKITKKAHFLNQKPLNQRLQNVIQQKVQLSQNLLSKYKPSFKPSIDPYSQFIAEINNENQGDFFNRLQSYKAKSMQLKQLKAEKVKQQQMKDVTFEPRINHRKRKTDHLLSSNNLVKRDQIDLQKQQKFKPTINKHSSLIMKSKILQNQQKDSCYDRLYKGSKVSKQKLNLQKQIQFAKYSFAPSINNKSKMMVQQKLLGKSKINIQKRFENDNKLQNEECVVEDVQYQQVMVSWNGSPLNQKHAIDSIQYDNRDHLWHIDKTINKEKQSMYLYQMNRNPQKNSRTASVS